MGNAQGKPVVFTDEVNLNHFRLLRVVGKGAFGKVRIVERKDTGLTFALKYIRKDEIIRSESVRNIIRERRMLEHLNHPFICNLRYSFQDMEYLYIVVDLMNGGDLRFHISRKTFTEDAVKFWIAELGCALRYIHKQGIIHRDVKPDNVLLDSEGHVHLADFNVASDFTPGKLLTSKSGTLAYLAPEVYRDRGYSTECDWWSLGVVFFECIYNKRPFRAHNHEKLAKEITSGNVHYPVTNPPVSMPCLHAISSLLERDKKKRIGAIGFSSFADNPFFQDIDFELLEQKKIEPIFRPSSDKTNFDATYDLEELLLEEAPLEARARRQKPREQLKDDATDKEIRADELHRMIETLFEPFNYTAVAGDRAPVTGDPTTAALGSVSEAIPLSSHSQSKSSTEELGQINESVASDPTCRPPEMKSLNGSPPLSENNPVNPTAAVAPRTSPPSNTKTAPPESSALSPTPSPARGGAPSSSNRLAKRSGGSRTTSMGGGVQVVLDETGSWSELADRSGAMPGGGADDHRAGGASSGGAGGNGSSDSKSKPTGMLGFLSRRRGRGSSPKPQERGVLGKEGARHIIS
ncbi:MAG: hypothetical protein M1837_002416 [Sclerophora amabilis]|nr:MAG: hypothetical protein M1837_002416 [Sclerophora amabilis]